MTRPLLRVIPSRVPEIGYSGVGPVFNLTCSVLAEKKDAIVDRATVTLEHERGQKVNLNWALLTETFSEYRGGRYDQIGKSQLAIALTVTTRIPVDRIIGFNDLAFQESVRAQSNVVNERLSFLRRSRPDAADEVLRSKEFADLVELYERRFPWQEGRYTAHLEMRMVGVPGVARQLFSFALSATDVESMRQNFTEIRRYQQELIAPPAKPSDYKWNWIYPPFR